MRYWLRNKLWVCMLALAFSCVQAFAFEHDGVYYNVISGSNNELKVIESPNHSYSGVINVPSTIVRDGVTYTVASVGYGAFSHCENLTKVTLPSTIEAIGECAFMKSGVANVDISKCKIKTIPYACFEGCKRLSGIEIPRTVKEIDRHAFLNYSGITTTIVIPNSVREIRGTAFSFSGLPKNLNYSYDIHIEGDMTPLQLFGSREEDGTISFPCKSLRIGRNIKSLNIPFGYNLKQVIIGKYVTYISDFVFSQCTGVTSITVESSEPFSITKDTFWSINKQRCTLTVPKGTKEKYATAPYWSAFQNIVER